MRVFSWMPPIGCVYLTIKFPYLYSVVTFTLQPKRTKLTMSFRRRPLFGQDSHDFAWSCLNSTLIRTGFARFCLELSEFHPYSDRIRTILPGAVWTPPLFGQDSHDFAWSCPNSTLIPTGHARFCIRLSKFHPYSELYHWAINEQWIPSVINILL